MDISFFAVLWFDECRELTTLQRSLRIKQAIELNELRHKSGPTVLMARAQSGTVVCVEVFKELQVVRQ